VIKRLVPAAALGVLVLAGCGGGLVNRMSVPQKVDVGTSAWCETLSQAPSIDPTDSSLLAMERDIITPSSGHDGMGLPVEGTRLEADVQAARAYNGSDQVKYLRAVQNVLADCRYILSRSH
jgi:hypothetical protein